MNQIRNKFNELQSKYTVVNAIKYFDFIQTCETVDVLNDFDCIFTEPDRGGIATESFILNNTFSNDSLFNMRKQLEGFVSEAYITQYPRLDHIRALESCIDIINEKIDVNDAPTTQELLCESLYYMNNEDNIVCESLIVNDNISHIISQLLSKDNDTDNHLYYEKLTSTLSESKINVQDAIDIVDKLVAVAIYDREVKNIDDNRNVFNILITKIKGQETDSMAKEIHIRKFTAIINKCSFIENDSFIELCDELNKILDELKSLPEPTVNGVVYSNEITTSTKLKTLDNMFLHNAAKFISTESTCPDIYGVYFDNMMKISQGREVVLEGKVGNIVKNVGGAVGGLAKQQVQVCTLFGGTKKYIEYEKKIERDIQRSKTKGSLAAIDITLNDIVEGAKQFLRGSFSFGNREQDLKNTKQFVHWYNTTYKSMMNQRSKDIDKMMKESTEYYVSESVVSRNTHLIIANMFKINKKTGDYSKIRPNLLKLAKRCKTKDEVTLLRKDVYTGIGQLSVIASKTDDKQKKANILEHISWLKTVYMPALTARNKEITKAVKEGTEVIVHDCEIDEIVFEYMNNELYVNFDPIQNIEDDEEEDEYGQYDDNEEEKEECNDDYTLDDEDHLEIYDIEDIYDDEIVSEGTKLDDARKKMNVQSNKIIKAGAQLGKNAEKVKMVAGSATRGVSTIGQNVDEKLTDTVNNVKKVYRNELRDDIIEDKTRVKLMRLVRNGVIAGTTVAVGQGIGAIAVITAFALKKNVKEKERRKILNELELELKILEEKLEDSKSDGDRENKYKLMRVKNQLEKDITRIKYRLSSDNQGV